MGFSCEIPPRQPSFPPDLELIFLNCGETKSCLRRLFIRPPAPRRCCWCRKGGKVSPRRTATPWSKLPLASPLSGVRHFLESAPTCCISKPSPQQADKRAQPRTPHDTHPPRAAQSSILEISVRWSHKRKWAQRPAASPPSIHKSRVDDVQFNDESNC